MKEITANYDESWKEALTEYFESFLTFFFPEQLQQKLVNKINIFEEERKMPFISPTEEMAIERGKEIGKEIGSLQKARDYVKTVLQTRLGEVSLEIIVSLAEISNLSILDEMLKLAVTVNSLEDFQQALELATSK